MLQLVLTLSDFERLHTKADSKHKTVTVEREALEKLLIDHSVILGLLNDNWIEYKDASPPKKPRPKLRIRKGIK